MTKHFSPEPKYHNLGSGENSLRLKKSVAVLASLLLAGCGSIAINPLNQSELEAQGKSDRLVAAAGVEPLAGALSLDGAIARALKYNLGARTRMMEEALAMQQYDVSKYDMLPKLVASAGYSRRNQDHTVRSIDSVTGQPSLANPSISSERSHTLSELGLTWSLLDFGLSHTVATQNADRVLIAAERRRKAMHLLVQDVRSTFWRAISAQKLRGQVQLAISQAEEALEDSRKAENERLRSPLDSLRYQKQLLENLRLLETIDHELSTARVELAALANLPLNQDFQLVEPDVGLDQGILKQPVENLEALAIARNADIREQHYNARIASLETRKAIMRMFPNLGLNFAAKHDNDRFLINQSWREAGLQLSWNLFNVLSGPAQVQMAEAGIALADQRRVATQMAVLAQVHVARLQYANAIAEYQRADSMWQVDHRIARHVLDQEQAQVHGKLERVASQTASILSLLRRYQALSGAHAASSRLQATLGLEPEIPSVYDASLQELTDAVKKSLSAMALSPDTVAASADTLAPAVPEASAGAQVVAGEARANAPDNEALASVRDRVAAWQGSWAASQRGRHFDFYSTRFSPEGRLTLARWQRLRAERMARGKPFAEQAEQPSVVFVGEDRVIARVARPANATNRKASHLVQVWINEGGQWRIENETTINREL